MVDALERGTGCGLGACEIMVSGVLFTAISRFKRRIRLDNATWFNQILRDHPELGVRDEYVIEVKKTIEDPDYVVSGWFGEYLALRFCDVALKSSKYLCVVYRELNRDGFVITTFFISKPHKLLRRGVLWRKRS
jgi:hypothetical protein